ncbi:MAG: alpha-amylase family glycosyl hydrolase [Thermoleophilia bacterium]
MSAPRPVRATYRLQLGPGLGFQEARALVPYLADLGISHLYLSPSLQARPGSTHGYDVTDPTRVSAELGGGEELRRLCGAGLGVVLDVVPNHMAACDETPLWADERERARVFDVDPATGRHRRFFDVDELAGVRVEDAAVLERTHEVVLRLVGDGLVDGLRIDHPDGLADPRGYLERLREAGVPHVWVEKILEPGEELRDWPVEGTTGYEAASDLTALCVDPAGEEPLSALWVEVSGDPRPFRTLAAEAKLEQARLVFQPEIDRLERELDETDRGRWDLGDALASLPVYRTYVEPWSGRVEQADRDAIAQAALPDDLAAALLLERPVPAAFVTRFQQTTGAVMAKGVEDTAFYRYLRLLALNEVGGDPGRFSLPVAAFHAASARRLARFPRQLLASTTHDTKRSGDVRARLAAIAGLGERWVAWTRELMDLTERRTRGGAPDPVERYLLLQTVVGAWPIEPERLDQHVEKALREAKRTTSWLEPDEGREAAVEAVARALVLDPELRDAIEPMARELARRGRALALAQLVLRLTMPGVPDVYQGDELELLALVDPDNRRRVDWAARRRDLDALLAGGQPSPATWKLATIQRLLALRARRPDDLGAGAYEPLDAGERAVAFRRGEGVLVAVALDPDATVVPLGGRPAGTWRDVLTGDVVEPGPALPLVPGGPPGRVLERLG